MTRHVFSGSDGFQIGKRSFNVWPPQKTDNAVASYFFHTLASLTQTLLDLVLRNDKRVDVELGVEK